MLSNLSPLGGAVTLEATALSFWLNHFIHHTQNAKWDTDTSAASSFSGYHGDKRHFFLLNPRSNRRALSPPHENTHRVPCGAETCTSFSPHWREDITSGRHGSVGAVHKGKTSVYLCVWLFASRTPAPVNSRYPCRMWHCSATKSNAAQKTTKKTSSIFATKKKSVFWED